MCMISHLFAQFAIYFDKASYNFAAENECYRFNNI